MVNKKQAIEKSELPLEENFELLLEEVMGSKDSFLNTVVKGKVVALEDDFVIVDVGLKSEGKIDKSEFQLYSKPEDSDGNVISVGDEVEVYVERIEDRHGEVVLSREKALRESAWVDLEKSYDKGERVNGVIVGRVKGGFTVDLGGAIAFLPGSQVDFRPIKDISPLMGVPQPVQILKMDRARGNIVVSRRAILEESRAEARSELVANMQEGTVLKGIVKNITDYGAFIDLGGVDGLLHVTDISWKRINHPSEVLHVGDSIDVQVIKFNQENQRISLGMKQLTEDPWKEIESRYTIGKKITGQITNVTDYGAFVEIEDGVEGLIHVTEMSWVKKNVPPQKIVSVSQEVEVVVLDIDKEKRRISLGLKQCTENPWQAYAEQNNVGNVIKGEIRNITEFGLFIALNDNIDGMIHLSDLSWTESGEDAIKNYKKAEEVEAKILEIDVEKERVCLGIKQLIDDPVKEGFSKLQKGSTVTCTVKEVQSTKLIVDVDENLEGTIKKTDLSRDRSEQRLDRFAEGDKVDAVVISLDKSSRKVALSIKAREIQEEKKAMEQYGSSDSGASLGDILGAALDKANQDDKK